jgi:DNA-binding protein H-NS
MAKINGIEKLSYVELINLQKRIEEAIAEKRAADAQTTKEQLRQIAEKAGFDIKELFGRRGSPKGTAVAKYRNPKDSAQTWTGRGRKPNWLVDAVKKGAKLESFAI